MSQSSLKTVTPVLRHNACTVVENVSKCRENNGHSALYCLRVTSVSENEMNIFRIPLCNVRHVNGMFDISQEIIPKKKKTHYLVKRSKILGKHFFS